MNIFPQIGMIVFMSMLGMYTLINHGKQYTFSAGIIALRLIFIFVLLFTGGFFENGINWPQIVYIILTSFALVSLLPMNNKVITRSFWSYIVFFTIYMSLMIFSGFFNKM